MKKLYERYREEILALIAILAPPLVAYVSDVILKHGLLKTMEEKWNVYIPILLLSYAVTYLIILRRQLRFFQKYVISHFRSSDERRYRNVIDQAHGTYYLLGMSAEEFQRHVPLKDYFVGRAASGHQIKNLRFLLLHPDSHFFTDRLLEVNPGSDVKSLIERKKGIMQSLFHGLKALPPQTIGHFEIRLFDAYPIWMMQFFDSTEGKLDGVPDAMVLSFHLRGAHSKLSTHYLLRGDRNPFFDSFVNYFERLWKSALPIEPDGSFPKIYSEESTRLRFLVFDFDGVIVESSELKRQAFLNSFKDARGAEKKKLAEVYDKNEGLTRDGLFHEGLSALGNQQPTERQLESLRSEYSNYYLARLDSIRLVDGLTSFCEAFKSKYRFAIVSNAPTSEVDAIVKTNGIQEWFAQIYAHPVSKVDGINRILKTFDLQPSNILYIGDTREDQIVCEATGVMFLARRHGRQFLRIDQPQRGFDTYEGLAREIYDLESANRSI